MKQTQQGAKDLTMCKTDSFNLLVLQLLNLLWVRLVFVSLKLLSYHIDKKLCVMLLPQ
jgi:hypothetical protein